MKNEITEWIVVIVFCGVIYYCCGGQSNNSSSNSKPEEWQPKIEYSESTNTSSNLNNNQSITADNFDFNKYMSSNTNSGQPKSNNNQLHTEHIDCGRVSRYIDDAYSYIKKAWNATSINDKQYYAKKAEDCLDDAGDECGSLRFRSDDSNNRSYLEDAQRELDDAEKFAKKSRNEDYDPEMIDYYLNKCVDEINNAIGYLNNVK